MLLTEQCLSVSDCEMWFDKMQIKTSGIPGVGFCPAVLPGELRSLDAEVGDVAGHNGVVFGPFPKIRICAGRFHDEAVDAFVGLVSGIVAQQRQCDVFVCDIERARTAFLTVNRPGFHAAVLLAASISIGPFVSA
ncbi:hypothetical protein QN357_19130 [Cryobacterium sp. RTC2.1]|uniref:hypothetical protein n=1 Tax=Cryobacterium sp. RTC2.1 TaxID=3048634 RepID=UPI002B23871A|nr:hypothetical protein [Cryobacterium sp. RTC2.1]MEB0005037.1 hypothetical protein [Cryobacterium sp. RTC2.1]